MESETKTFKEQLFKDHPKDPKHFWLWLVLFFQYLAALLRGYEWKIRVQSLLWG